MKLARIGLAALGTIALASGVLAADQARVRAGQLNQTKAPTAKVRMHIQSQPVETLGQNLKGAQSVPSIVGGAKARVRVVLFGKDGSTADLVGSSPAPVRTARVRIHLSPAVGEVQGPGVRATVGRQRETTAR